MAAAKKTHEFPWTGGAKMPWREAKSRIRCPETGLLLDLHEPQRRHAAGMRMVSSQDFRVRAAEILADENLTPGRRKRLLEMNRRACALFMQAVVAGATRAKVDLALRPGEAA